MSVRRTRFGSGIGRVLTVVHRARLPRAADRRRRPVRGPALDLRAPAVLRGALPLLRLQRGHHQAPRRRRPVPGSRDDGGGSARPPPAPSPPCLADALGRRDPDLLSVRGSGAVLPDGRRDPRVGLVEASPAEPAWLGGAVGHGPDARHVLDRGSRCGPRCDRRVRRRSA